MLLTSNTARPSDALQKVLDSFEIVALDDRNLPFATRERI